MKRGKVNDGGTANVENYVRKPTQGVALRHGGGGDTPKGTKGTCQNSP